MRVRAFDAHPLALLLDLGLDLLLAYAAQIRDADVVLRSKSDSGFFKPTSWSRKASCASMLRSFCTRTQTSAFHTSSSSISGSMQGSKM